MNEASTLEVSNDGPTLVEHIAGQDLATGKAPNTRAPFLVGVSGRCLLNTDALGVVMYASIPGIGGTSKEWDPSADVRTGTQVLPCSRCTAPPPESKADRSPGGPWPWATRPRRTGNGPATWLRRPCNSMRAYFVQRWNLLALHTANPSPLAHID